MASTEIKLYAASIFAERPFRKTERPNGPSHYEHLPAIIAANSMEEAAEEITAGAFERWPVSEGWFGHNVSLIAAKVEAAEFRTIHLSQKAT